MEPKNTPRPSRFGPASALRIIAAALSRMPRCLADAATDICDFLIVLLPRLIRGSLLLIAATAAVALAYLALRTMWSLVCWTENWLTG